MTFTSWLFSISMLVLVIGLTTQAIHLMAPDLQKDWKQFKFYARRRIRHIIRVWKSN